MPGRRDNQEIEHFVERFAQVLVDSGMPRIASRIAITIMTTDEGRLTAAELAERLHASPAAISGGVRYLTQVGIAQRGRDRGSRRDHYAIQDDWLYQTIAQRDSILARWSSGLHDGARAVGEDTPAGRRFAESVEFFEFLRKEMEGVLDRWEDHRRSRA
ncbi:GbsR/MarR family transcriptional regulator [Luedemannella helvata]|uniref:MarR family transcriptional regulator n=1 Tax=Luedemannella helvata TaxID=349315 RepID=A0ABN2JXB1_9ACTN